MERVDKIMNHPVFRETMKKIEEAETDRVFCCHDLSHLLNVARIFYILVLEERAPYEKELVYATALLHDIGRYEQYESDIPHNEAGAYMAQDILKDCGFSSDECSLAVSAIREHRRGGEGGDFFGHLLYRADKLSRDCYNCDAINDCYWSNEQKNNGIEY